MSDRDLLTEDQVIQGVENFLRQKGRTVQKILIKKSSASKKERGVDLIFKLQNERKWGNRYFIEAKGNLKADGSEMTSTYNTNFRWALSQIILRIKVDSRRYNYIYGIAMPRSDVEKCIGLICDNWALRYLKIRLYGSFYDDEGNLTAKEYLPKYLYRKASDKTSDKTSRRRLANQ